MLWATDNNGKSHSLRSINYLPWTVIDILPYLCHLCQDLLLSHDKPVSLVIALFLLPSVPVHLLRMLVLPVQTQNQHICLATGFLFYKGVILSRKSSFKLEMVFNFNFIISKISTKPVSIYNKLFSPLVCVYKQLRTREYSASLPKQCHL